MHTCGVRGVPPQVFMCSLACAQPLRRTNARAHLHAPFKLPVQRQPIGFETAVMFQVFYGVYTL